jgi:hypothetical protein
MARTAAIAAVLNRNPRLARTFGWALLVEVMWWLLIYPMGWFIELTGISDVGWSIGPIVFAPHVLFTGLLFSGPLGFLLWRGGHARGRRAVGFALLAMFWFNFGGVVGYDLISSVPWLAGDFLMFLEWFSGFLTAAVWVTLAGLLLLPALRSRWAVAWLLGVGAVFAVLVGAYAAVDEAGTLDALNYLLAAWGAVQAGAFSLALPPTRRSAKQSER